MATPGTEERRRLDTEISARLPEGQRRAGRRLLWVDRLTSLWAPLLVFGLAFLPYVVLIESSREAAGWAQPLLKGFGLLMLVWFAGLLASRLLLARFSRLRGLRHGARELEQELGGLLDRHGDQLERRVREELVAQGAEVRAASVAGDPAALEKQLGKLSTLVDKHLSKWRRQSISDFLIGFGKALAVALLIRSVVVEPFKIPSGSMLPTLNVGDQVFVNKFIYGVRIPWLNKVPFVIVRPPRRGDVIVFENPLDSSKDFIKRVVGIPGDRVEISNYVISVNGQAQPRRVISNDPVVWNQDLDSGVWFEQQGSALYDEDLSGVHHESLQGGSSLPNRPDYRAFTVPEGQVFVMGDNRDNSADGRFGFGVDGHHEELTFVPYGNIKGKAMVIWLSLSYDGLLSSVARVFGGSGAGLRVDRLFLPVR